MSYYSFLHESQGYKGLTMQRRGPPLGKNKFYPDHNMWELFSHFGRIHEVVFIRRF